MGNKFVEGQEVEYKGDTGVIRFIFDEYLTVCLKRRCDGMIGDICLVIYSYQWDEIVPLR